MNRVVIVLVTLTLVAGFCVAPGQSADDPPKPRNFLMQQKLSHSQKVLEGLATRNFDMIAQHSDELIVISKKAEWQVLKTPEYVRYSDEFRRSADTIVRSAKDKNLDGSALAYVQMTMACVNCHKYVREVRMASLPLDSTFGH